MRFRIHHYVAVSFLSPLHVGVTVVLTVPLRLTSSVLYSNYHLSMSSLIFLPDLTNKSVSGKKSASSPKRCKLYTYICAEKASFPLQRKSHLCIPRKGIARPQSQFPHSCICERFIHILPGSVHIFSMQQNRLTDSGNI